MVDVLYVLNSITAYYALFIVPFGTISNTLAIFIVCKSKSLRNNNIIAFLNYAYIVSTIGTYFWCLDSYFTTFYGKSIGDHSAETCRIFLYFTICTQNLSYYSWVV